MLYLTAYVLCIHSIKNKKDITLLDYEEQLFLRKDRNSTYCFCPNILTQCTFMNGLFLCAGDHLTVPCCCVHPSNDSPDSIL